MLKNRSQGSLSKHQNIGKMPLIHIANKPCARLHFVRRTPFAGPHFVKRHIVLQAFVNASSAHVIRAPQYLETGFESSKCFHCAINTDYAGSLFRTRRIQFAGHWYSARHTHVAACNCFTHHNFSQISAFVCNTISPTYTNCACCFYLHALSL